MASRFNGFARLWLALGGAWISALVFGISSDSITAIAIGESLALAFAPFSR